jgi:predicted Ser/Thr protein kinase
MNSPEVIGRYEIIEELGRGAMGSVFKARDPAVGRTVALKTIHSMALEGAQSEEYRMRFSREARASGVLAHPGIVPVFDVGEHRGAPFLVMEFVAGRTLADAMKKGERFTQERVCEIGQQLADALGYAHRQGVIHRDIKPANILLTSREVYGSERARITDFGIAKLAASEITTTGQMLGTPSFMPPEQFTGAPIDGRADLFSLGVVLYFLATGEQPFPGETMTAVSYKVVHTEPIPPAKLNPAVPAPLEKAILKCLAKNPAERYQTGEEVAHDLATIRAGAAGGAPEPMAPVAIESDATLGPVRIPVAPRAAQARTSGTPPASPQKTPKKLARPLPFESVFAVVLLSVAGFVAIVALGWMIMVHHRNLVALEQRHAATVPAPQTASQPAAPAAQPASAAPVVVNQMPATVSAPGRKTVAETTPVEATPVAKKPTPAKPPAGNPSPSTPASSAAPAPPVASSLPPPPPTATASTPRSAATMAFDPRKLDPNTNAKLKIDLSHVPAGLPYVVEMNGKVYLRGTTGDKVDLDNLYVPPGTQKFQVTMKSGGQQKASNVVGQDFKAKKRETLKIELTKQTKATSKSADPLGGDAKIVVSLVSGLSIGGLHL